jgi:hypothetical protein
MHSRYRRLPPLMFTKVALGYFNDFRVFDCHPSVIRTDSEHFARIDAKSPAPHAKFIRLLK